MLTLTVPFSFSKVMNDPRRLRATPVSRKANRYTSTPTPPATFSHAGRLAPQATTIWMKSGYSGETINASPAIAIDMYKTRPNRK